MYLQNLVLHVKNTPECTPLRVSYVFSIQETSSPSSKNKNVPLPKGGAKFAQHWLRQAWCYPIACLEKKNDAPIVKLGFTHLLSLN